MSDYKNKLEKIIECASTIKPPRELFEDNKKVKNIIDVANRNRSSPDPNSIKILSLLDEQLELYDRIDASIEEIKKLIKQQMDEQIGDNIVFVATAEKLINECITFNNKLKAVLDEFHDRTEILIEDIRHL